MAFPTKQSCLRWTDADRVQLVEAVIKVEQKMISEATNSSQNSAGERVAKRNSIKNSTEKWDAIADLLPPQFREKYWNPNKHIYNHPKCCGMFHNLLKTYRDKVGGRATRNSRWRMSAPLLEVLKRREDLFNGRCSVSEKTFSRSVPENGVDTSRRLHHEGNLEQISPTGKSSLGVDASRFNRGRVSDKKVLLKWTEAARLQIIKAVIKVETEMMNEKNTEGGCLTGNWTGKWNRIAGLLPPGLQERARNSNNRTQGEQKCCRLFYNLISAYRRQRAAGKASKGFSGVLTKDVVKLLKKREELLSGSFNTQEKKKSFRSSRRSNCIRACKNSHKLSQNRSELAASLKASADDTEKSSLGQSIGSGRGKGTDSFSQKADGSDFKDEDSKKFPQNDGDVIGTSDRNYTGHDLKSTDRETSEYSIGLMSSRSGSEFKDSANKAEPDGSRSGVETRAQTRAKTKDCNSATIRPTGELSTPRPKRQRTNPMSQPTYDEHLQTVLDQSLKRIDSEFPDLSSWLQSQATRDEFKNKVILLARRKIHAKRSRVTGEMIDYSSLSKMIDHLVRALFYKLRIRIAVELNGACEEIAQEVAEAAQVLNTSRHSGQFK